ncbi:unnamed protein product [Didymodactylos carnosus]|uniref:Uncharacterized protein n=1 Tax=Didymodactylos carnosus TaxID=1234261 RepID=A0A813WX07_9BILA|nr:unnamed protein product [Didymodactylos carnosus]CAF0858470.1 unnamed protein product [Didymodactylos carnosus]CAF3600122.1 unnamed protein product [Didymodactylos carnosus]CAF3646128.1 unnamed protein product [Didymodactylos carnosus]
MTSDINQVKIRHGSYRSSPQQTHNKLRTTTRRTAFISTASVNKMVPPLLINLTPPPTSSFTNLTSMSMNGHRSLQRNLNITRLNGKINDVRGSPLLNGILQQKSTESIRLTPIQFVRKRINHSISPSPSPTVLQNNLNNKRTRLGSERALVQNGRPHPTKLHSEMRNGLPRKGQQFSSHHPPIQIPQKQRPLFAPNVILLNRIKAERNPHATPPLPFISGPTSTPKAKMFASVQAPTIAPLAYEERVSDITIDEFDNDEPIYVIAQYDPSTSNKPSEAEIHHAVENQLANVRKQQQQQQLRPYVSPSKIIVEYNKPPPHPQLKNQFQHRNQSRSQHQQISSSIPQNMSSVNTSVQPISNNDRPQQNLRPFNRFSPVQHQHFQPIKAQRQDHAINFHLMQANMFRTIPGTLY